MRLVVSRFDQREWAEVVRPFRDLSLVQTWEYAEAKAEGRRWAIERAVFLQDGDVPVGAAQCLVRRVPVVGGGLVWVNRGPLWKRPDGVDTRGFLTMLGDLRRHWVERERMYLRVAPSLHEEETETAALESLGFRSDGLGWASARVDLGGTLDALRGNLDQKWRNCLNKAERQGLEATASSDATAFEEVIAHYCSLLTERAFETTVTPELLASLQRLLPPERKLFAIVARHGDVRLGGILLARYGDTCEYLVGALPVAGRAMNVGHFLLWRAVCEMKRAGCRWLDLGGMDPSRTPAGILHFKAGLRGTAYRLAPELEITDGGWRSEFVRRVVRERAKR